MIGSHTYTLCRSGTYPVTVEHRNKRNCFRCNKLVYVSDDAIRLSDAYGMTNVFVCQVCAQLPDTGRIFYVRYLLD